MYFFFFLKATGTVTCRGSKWSNPCYSGPEYMFRGNYPQDSRGGIYPRILGGGGKKTPITPLMAATAKRCQKIIKRYHKKT